MNTRIAIAAVIGLSIVAAAVIAILAGTRKHHLELVGGIQNVRMHSPEAESVIVFLDFRVTNPSTQQFVVRDLEVVLETEDGKTITGDNVAEVDAERLFKYFPALGQKFNPTLVVREKINSGQTVDRMISARLSATPAQFEARKSIVIRIEDVDGTIAEIKR
jgi:hypothetical protein